jgi:hypothetical protein
MYVPPYHALLRSLRTTKSAIDGAADITISVELLKLLLQLAIAQSDFDEEGYLQVNQDVRDAVARGQIASGRVHFIGFGYFEGRVGGGVDVDEKWYLRTYPDVAPAVKDGRVESARQHFNAIGAGEGRSPNADEVANASQWKKALHGR